MLSESSSPTSSSFRGQEETKNSPGLLEEKPENCASGSVPTMPLCYILLPENLTRIFEFLSLPDRKNVRLTCELWYECSLKVSITRREKFVFRPNFNFSDIAKTLLKPIFPRLNLEFQGLCISRPLADEVWETCGPRVYSLNLYNCCLEDGVARLIIEHCINLVELKIGEPSGDHPFSTKKGNCYKILPKLTELDYFVQKNMTRLQLLTFTLATRALDLLGEDILSKIFRIFPHVEHLHIESLALKTCEEADEVKLPLQIKDFVFKRGKHVVVHCWLDRPLSSLQDLRLTKLDVSLSVDVSRRPINLMKELILNLFRAQKNLKVINLNIISFGVGLRERPRSLIDIMFCALENCPNLREFCASGSVVPEKPMWLSCNEFAQFLTLMSNLYSFVFDYAFVVESLPLPHPENSILHTLSLVSFLSNLSEDVIIFFLQHHSRLKHLKIDGPSSEKILEEIFKMPSLQTLVLLEIERRSESGFTYDYNVLNSKRASIKQLQKLEYLEIASFYMNCPVFSEATVAVEFCFPNLKCLKLKNIVCFDLKGTESVLSKIILNIPTLEVLEVSGYKSIYLKKMGESKSFKRIDRFLEEPWDFESMIDFCRHGKNLRLLSLPQIGSDFIEPNFQSKFVHKLFQACSNLRYFLDFETAFSFNPFTKEITKCCRQGLKFPESRSTFESIEVEECLNHGCGFLRDGQDEYLRLYEYH